MSSSIVVDSLPLALIDGPASRRLAARIAEDGFRLRPKQYFDQSSIVLGIAGDEAQEFAEALADHTGRDYRVISRPSDALKLARRSAVSLVTVVTNVDDDLLAESVRDGQLGLIVARSLPQLSALVARILLDPGEHTMTSAFVEFLANPGDRPNSTATLAGVRGSLRSAPDFLGVHGHGRCCMVHLEDGVICGLAGPVSSAAQQGRPDYPKGFGLPSCQYGEGCVRDHWSGPRLLPGAELNATVVLLDTCQMQHLSAILPGDTSLPLAILDGDAVAVLASPSERDGVELQMRGALTALAHGMTLGQTMVLLNDSVRLSRSDFGEFALLGDAGMRLSPEISPPLEMAPGDAITVGRNGVIVQYADRDRRIPLVRGGRALRVADQSYIVWPPDEAEEAEVTLDPGIDPGPLLESLGADLMGMSQWFAYGLAPAPGSLPRMRAELLQVASSSAEEVTGPELGAQMTRLAESIDELVHAAVSTLLRRTVSSYFQFTETHTRTSVRVANSSARCPECGREARCYTWRHVITAVVRSHLVCHVCGDVRDEEPGGVHIMVEGQHRVARGQRLRRHITLSGPADQSAHGWVGSAFQNGELHGDPMLTLVPFDLAPGARTEVITEHEIPGDFKLVDRHVERTFAVSARGIAACSRPVWVTP